MRDEKRFAAAALMAGALLASTLLVSTRAFAQISDDVVKLGVTNDQVSIYSAAGGFGAVIATRMAVEDFGGTVLGKKIEVVFADNQNKSDIGVSIVRRGSTPRRSTPSSTAEAPRSAWQSRR